MNQQENKTEITHILHTRRVNIKYIYIYKYNIECLVNINIYNIYKY